MSRSDCLLYVRPICSTCLHVLQQHMKIWGRLQNVGPQYPRVRVRAGLGSGSGVRVRIRIRGRGRAHDQLVCVLIDVALLSLLLESDMYRLSEIANPVSQSDPKWLTFNNLAEIDSLGVPQTYRVIRILINRYKIFLTATLEEAL